MDCPPLCQFPWLHDIAREPLQQDLCQLVNSDTKHSVDIVIIHESFGHLAVTLGCSAPATKPILDLESVGSTLPYSAKTYLGSREHTSYLTLCTRLYWKSIICHLNYLPTHLSSCIVFLPFVSLLTRVRYLCATLGSSGYLFALQCRR